MLFISIIIYCLFSLMLKELNKYDILKKSKNINNIYKKKFDSLKELHKGIDILYDYKYLYSNNDIFINHKIIKINKLYNRPKNKHLKRISKKLINKIKMNNNNKFIYNNEL